LLCNVLHLTAYLLAISVYVRGLLYGRCVAGVADAWFIWTR